MSISQLFAERFDCSTPSQWPQTRSVTARMHQNLANKRRSTCALVYTSRQIAAVLNGFHAAMVRTHHHHKRVWGTPLSARRRVLLLFRAAVCLCHPSSPSRIRRSHIHSHTHSNNSALTTLRCHWKIVFVYFGWVSERMCVCVCCLCARIYARGGEILLNFKGLGTRTHISHAYKHIRALGRQLNCLKGELPSHCLSNSEMNSLERIDFTKATCMD